MIMKLSYYNFFIENNNIVVGYNAVSNCFITMTKPKYQYFLKYSDKLDLLEKENSKLLAVLLENNFIVPSSKNELNEIRLINKEVCFNKHFDLTILPTMDCNLKCWYCWENHIPKSVMTTATQELIKKFVYRNIKNNSLDSVHIEWFGGEPLLYFDEVVYPLCCDIKKFTEDNNKCFTTGFITNATLINDKMIEKLADLEPDFQITLDGNKARHNKIRSSKHGTFDTYEQSLSAIYKIVEKLPNSRVKIRINFDNQTFDNIEEILKDLDGLNRQNVVVYFERVWQTIKANTYYQKLTDVVYLFTINNFEVAYGNFMQRSFSCKVDRYQQAAINYNGKVYKCTGRPFTDGFEEGILTHEGEINWSREKLTNRLGLATFENDLCTKCKLLPACMGPCSQKCIELNWKDFKKQCALNTLEIPIEEYILFLFNNLYNNQMINRNSIDLLRQKI